jgi:hypothetical protein
MTNVRELAIIKDSISPSILGTSPLKKPRIPFSWKISFIELNIPL